MNFLLIRFEHRDGRTGASISGAVDLADIVLAMNGLAFMAIASCDGAGADDPRSDEVRDVAEKVVLATQSIIVGTKVERNHIRKAR